MIRFGSKGVLNFQKTGLVLTLEGKRSIHFFKKVWLKWCRDKKWNTTALNHGCLVRKVKIVNTSWKLCVRSLRTLTWSRGTNSRLPFGVISLIYGIALWIPWSLQTIPQAPARSALFFTMGYLVGPAVLWPREGILETRRLVSSQTFYAAPGFGVWYSGFSYDHKRVRVLERPISPEKTRLTKNFRRWPWCSNAWRDSGRAYPLLRRQNRALLSEWPNLIALNFAFF